MTEAILFGLCAVVSGASGWALSWISSRGGFRNRLRECIQHVHGAWFEAAAKEHSIGLADLVRQRAMGLAFMRARAEVAEDIGRLPAPLLRDMRPRRSWRRGRR